MRLSEEMAVRLHRMMWSDMQKELGDKPSGKERGQFKFAWIYKHFPSESVANDCWLCEYASSVMKPGDHETYCKYCPISWPFLRCNTLDFSYAKAPISEILALPAKNKEIEVKLDDTVLVRSYYQYREELLSKASGRPASTAIEDHVKAIQEKAVQQSNLSKIYGDTKMELAKASGLKAADTTTDHIKEIKEKAVEEYFANTPGAKLATMDVDQTFKQYADEQKAPIFRALAEASGLSAGNESVKAHISLIRDTAKQNGRIEKCKEIFGELSDASGVSEGDWCLPDHIHAIQKKASNEKELSKIREELKNAVGTLKLYQSTLSYESNLPSNAPIANHIKKIREYAFSDGQDAEREHIMDKIGEMLNDKPTGTCKDI